jgi:MFS family permease
MSRRELTSSALPNASPSRRSLAGLDWTNFFLADVRTGVGPFLAVYLTGLHWSMAAIGLSLTVAEIAGVLTQAPGGALMDRVHSKRLTVGIALAVLTMSALAVAEFPSRAVVTTAQAALGMTGSIFLPGIGAITLGLVGYTCLGERFGRNTSFGSAGNVVAAITMGAIGYRYSTRAIFFFVALLSIPATLALLLIRGDEIDYERARGATAREKPASTGLRELFCDRRLVIFAVVVMLFNVGNGAMLPFAGQMISRSHPERGDIWMGALLMVPQVVMTIISPPIGRFADRRGRKPILLAGLAFLPLRALLFVFVRNPEWLVAAQVFDGLAAAASMVVGALIIADCTEGTGHYNLAVGAMGVAVGIGASISTALAGVIADRWGFGPSFMVLAAAGLACVLVFAWAMPETHTRPPIAASDMPRAA